MASGKPSTVLSQNAFYREWLKRAFGGRLAWVERFEFLLVLGSAPISRWDRIEEPVSILVWALPLSLFLGTVLVGMIIAPYTIYEPTAQELVEITSPAAFPDVEIEKHSMEQRPIRDRDGSLTLLYILRRVRITNRDVERVSLGFALNVRRRGTLHIGISSIIGQPNIPPGIFGMPPLPFLQTPLDLEPKSSVLGNIAFALASFSDEKASRGDQQEPELPPEVELEVSDYLSGTQVRLSPSSGFPPLGGMRHKEVATDEARHVVSHGDL